MSGDDPHTLPVTRPAGSFAYRYAKQTAMPAAQHVRRALRCCTALGTGLVASAILPVGAALAQAAEEAPSAGRFGPLLNFSATEIMVLAVFGGAMSFALMSAFWLIRERGRILTRNTTLRTQLRDLRAGNERLEALLDTGDQCIVVWNAADEKPNMVGRIEATKGVPADRAEFLAFGRWLNSDSAISFEGALKRLRLHAEAFDLPLVTVKGGVLEAQGRTSGGHAFVRFVELSGERLTLSRLEADHTRLLASFESIKSMFEALPMPVWLRDPAGALYWVNGAYLEAVESADTDQVIDKQTELLDQAERKQVASAQRERNAFSGSLPAVIAGDRRLLDITEIRSQAGLAGIAIDRNEIETVRATLKQTIAGHVQTLDHLATAVAMFDDKQQLKFYNSSFQKLWNLPAGLLQSAPSNAELLDALRAERKVPEVADWRKWRDQQLEIYRALEAREDWWHLPDGQTLRVVVNPHNQGGATWVFENVTEQLALQSNYNALMRIQGETLDHLNEAVAVFGSDGKMRLFNPAFMRIWSLPSGSISAGIHIGEIIELCRDKAQEPETLEEIATAITSFDDQRGDLSGRLEINKGEAIDYSLVRLPDGQTMLTFVDRTASVNIERALKERNDALEQSDHLKNRFIQHVSYELRAPLTSISGFAELLGMHAMGALNEKQEEYVDHISSASGTLKNIVDDILDLATIDAGALALNLAPVEADTVIAECLADLGETMTQRGVTAKTIIGRGGAALLADRARLQQILTNLLSNAVRFSPDGGNVTIETTVRAGQLELSVADEGPGIPEQYRKTIFGRFESGTSGDRRRGAGLGLSIVKALVELHGGSISVEDAGERGARFVCRFQPGSGQASRAA